MLQIGKLELDAPFFQAGLAGYSDAAMRLVAREHGCPYCVTEAMLDQFLIRGGKGLQAARLDPRDHPIAGQLMGNHPDDIAKATAILLELGYDVIDLNLACPVRKIRRKARGGHLLQDPQAAISILRAARDVAGDRAPCTVKLRRATDDSVEAQDHFHQILQAAIEMGYVAAVVHGRSVQQKYLGASRWSFLTQLVKTYGHIPDFTLGGSGDIWAAPDIFRMIAQTGIAWVSVARGCIGNPWLFTQARQLMRGQAPDTLVPPSVQEQRQVLMEHFDLSLQLHGERKAAMMMRKFAIKFAIHHPQSQAVKKAFIQTQSLADWRHTLDQFYCPGDAGSPDASRMG